MSNIVLWAGLTLILAVVPALALFNVSVDAKVIIGVGGWVMIVGWVLLILGR